MLASLDPVYLDDFLVVVEKPAGLLAVPGRGADKQDCLSTRLQADLPDTLTVHRLDMATSGLMVFGRGAEMQRALSRLFHERKVEKRYIAAVAGRVVVPAGEINLPLMADWPNRPMQIVNEERGKPSLTRYRALAYVEDTDTTRVELEPVTGRTHQLRVHLAAIGHSIMGDTLYGGRQAARLMLHACALGFRHPGTGAVLSFSSQPTF